MESCFGFSFHSVWTAAMVFRLYVNTPQWDVKGWRNMRKFAREVRQEFEKAEIAREREAERQEWIARVKNKLKKREQERVILPIREQQEQ